MNDREIKKIKESRYFPEEYIEDFSIDYEELIKEKEFDQLKWELKKSSSKNLFDLFEVLSQEQRYFLYNIEFR
ncbi:hypothetical protein [Aquimarina aggregata]|uniref:hypothetical protein n=1 Tax=Aquimarina aggregata TaxID=1642818 RepID=UPI00248F661E|nr:hypothetical protein [Aquimarina aggregata]